MAPTQIQVTATNICAYARTTVDIVTNVLEEEINGVGDMKYSSSSTSSDGVSNIIVSFPVAVNRNTAQVNVQNRLNQATISLPEVAKHTGVTVKAASPSLLLAYGFYADKEAEGMPVYDPFFISNYIDRNLLNEIRHIPGIGQARIIGDLGWLPGGQDGSALVKPAPMSEAGARRRSRRSSPQAAAAPQPPKRWPRWLLPLVAGLAFGSGYALTDRLLALQAGGPVKLDQTFDVKPFPGTSLESLRLRYGADRQELRADLELIEAERQQNETAAKAKREAAERTRQQQETSGSQAGDSTSGSSAESGGASGAAEEAPRSEPIPEPGPPTLEAPPPPAPEPQP